MKAYPCTSIDGLERGTGVAYLRSSSNGKGLLAFSSSSSSEDDVSFGSDDTRASPDNFSIDASGSPPDTKNQPTSTDLDVALYMAKREMTPMQEYMNAITMVPNVLYCFIYLLAGTWLSQQLINETRDAMNKGDYEVTQPFGYFQNLLVDEHGCVSWSWFPNMYALPPLPVFATAAGIVIHAPFSIIYHGLYVHRFPPGVERADHWSRRMDQAMIHVASAFLCYATSGNVRYFLGNAIYNAHCFVLQFERKVRPKRNQRRIVISMLLYAFPVLHRGEWALFGKIFAIFVVSGWLFAKYPIGGWSHSAFHLVIALLPPIIMTGAADLPASRPQLEIAAQCAAMAQL